ncbi:MAG: hypothetical protein ABIH59_03250 [archaeon]
MKKYLTCGGCPLYDPSKLGVECAIYCSLNPGNKSSFGTEPFAAGWKCQFGLLNDFDFENLQGEGVLNVIRRCPSVYSGNIKDISLEDIPWPLKE